MSIYLLMGCKNKGSKLSTFRQDLQARYKSRFVEPDQRMLHVFTSSLPIQEGRIGVKIPAEDLELLRACAK